MSGNLTITLTAHERDSNNVTIAFTMGVTALEKGHKASIILLSDAVHLAAKGYADKIDIGEPFKAIAELLPVFMQNGGQLYVCKACMVHNGVSEESLIENSIIISAPEVVDLIMQADKMLQLN